MVALTNGRVVSSRANDAGALGVAQGEKIFEGGLVCASAGVAVVASAALGLIALGVALAEADNTDGNDGDIIVEYRKGTFRFANSADADEITAADIGKRCYIIDDQTVARTNGGNARSPAGRVIDVDSKGVWVEVNPDERKIYVPLRITNLVGGTASVYGFTAPVEGEITDIRSSLEGHALTTGNATITGKIGATAITGGVVTIAQAGSAIGDLDQSTPTAANVVSVGDRVNFTVGGTNDDAAAFAELVVEITY